MTQILLATDGDDVFAEIDGALGSDSVTVSRVRAGVEVLPVVRARRPDLILLDLQIGNMGGVATAMQLGHEFDAGRLEEIPIALLLDRRDDVFVASESGVDGWLVKPLSSLRLRRLVSTLLDGETLFEGRDSAA